MRENTSMISQLTGGEDTAHQTGIVEAGVVVEHGDHWDLSTPR